MLISKPRPPQSMSLAEMVQSGLIPKVKERDLVCKKCVDQGLEGLIFEDEQGELICPKHGPVGMFVSRIINEATPQFRGRYEYELTRRKPMNNQLMTTQDNTQVRQLDQNQMIELMTQMFMSPAGIKNLVVRNGQGKPMVAETQKLRRQAALELAYLYLENDCDARKREAYIFPVYDENDKSKPKDEKSCVGFQVATGYNYHHRKAEDFGLQTVGRVDFTWGEPRALSETELKARGVRTEDTVCPDCEGTGKWKKKEGRECFKCNSSGTLKAERVLAVEASLYVLSQAKLAKEAGIPYTPYKYVAMVSLDSDTAWKGSDLFEKAYKRARVGCLRQYAPMRSHGGLVIGYSETPEDLDMEAMSDEYIDVAYTRVEATPSPEETKEPQPEGEVESA